MLVLGLGLESDLDLMFKQCTVVFAGNAVDVKLTDDDNDDNSSLSSDLLLLLAIKLYPSEMNECLNECLNEWFETTCIAP